MLQKEAGERVRVSLFIIKEDDECRKEKSKEAVHR